MVQSKAIRPESASPHRSLGLEEYGLSFETHITQPALGVESGVVIGGAYFDRHAWE